MVPALLAITATVAPSVLVVPGSMQGDRGARDAFQEAFHDAVEATFLARRYGVITNDRACETDACSNVDAARAKTRLWASASVLEYGDECFARARLRDVVSARWVQRIELPIKPCTPEKLLAAAEDLGRKIGEGPRRALLVDEALTPLSIPVLDFPEMPPVRYAQTATRPIDAVDLAVLKYRRDRVVLAVHETLVIAVQDGAPISDCELFDRAGIRPTPDEEEICAGNAWEGAWAPAVIAGLLVIPGAANAAEGDSPALLISALGVALGSAALAYFFDEDPPVAERGEHAVTLDVLEELVEGANSRLQQELGLSDAELRIRDL